MEKKQRGKKEVGNINKKQKYVECIDKTSFIKLLERIKKRHWEQMQLYSGIDSAKYNNHLGSFASISGLLKALGRKQNEVIERKHEFN